MYKRAAFVLVLLLGSPAQAELLSLICEHGSGVSTSTGLPGHAHAEIFRIDFDTRKNAVVTPFFAELNVKFEITDYSVNWSFRVPSANETYVYQLNRSSGTLFVTIVTADDRLIAKGKCNKPKSIL